MKDGKWEYKDFVSRITAIEADVKKLKNEMIDRQIASDQHRLALIKALEGLERGLTESPYKFSEKERQAWAGARNGKVWGQIKQLPY